MVDRSAQVRDRFVALNVVGHPTSGVQYARTVLSFANLLSSLVVLAFFETGLQPVAWSAPADGPTETDSQSFNGSRAGDQREVANIPLCWCPPGRFLMGSPVHEPGHRANEAQVEVTLTKGFWMGKYEVSQRHWGKIAGDLPGIVNADVGDDFPVYSVSFPEAEKFCRQLTALAHKSSELPADWEFRLPTEAQWEYACRAGSTTAFSYGMILNEKIARFGMPYNGTPTGVPGSASSQVGSHAANSWGLHDMHGNEWEWCRDWYHAQLPGGVDPDLFHDKGTPNGDGTFSRVRRGGAWVENAEFCRSAVRLRYEPERRADHIGFRVIAFRP